MAIIVERLTLQDIRDAKPKIIYYGAVTPWWTHREMDLHYRGPGDIPCDPLGGVLFQTDQVEKFLQCAEKAATFYGKYGLRAFMAAHNMNCDIGPQDGRHTCMTSWAEYNDAIDRMLTNTVEGD